MAAPNVKLDGGVFSSLRMMHLGAALGTSIYDAIGRMGHLWQWCTERQSEVLPESLMRAVIDPNLVIDADLGERVEGGIRLKGTSERIGWYGKLQKSGKKAAAKRWRSHPKKTDGLPIDNPLGDPSPSDGSPIEEEVVVEDEEGSLSSPGKGKGVPRGKGAPEAVELSECLRDQLLAEKPNHAIGDEKAWAKRRAAWARGFSAILRKGHSPERVREVVAYVFGDQGGTEFRFVIESPSALDEKWDRIERAMVRKPGARRNGYYAVTGEEKYAGGEVEI